MDKVWDPLRKKEVPATAEERVRQWFIEQLRVTFGVPLHQMMSEVGFKYGGKQYRADILVYGRGAEMLAIVECKRPDVDISAAVAEQAMRYNMVLGVRWLILTNGTHTYIYRKEGSAFVPHSGIPSYEDMLCL